MPFCLTRAAYVGLTKEPRLEFENLGKFVRGQVFIKRHVFALGIEIHAVGHSTAATAAVQLGLDPHLVAQFVRQISTLIAKATEILVTEMFVMLDEHRVRILGAEN